MKSTFFKNIFKNFDSKKYFEDNNLQNLFSEVDIGIKFESVIKDPFERVNPKNQIQFEPDYSDLSRLHYIVVKRKVTTILEFGVGKSSIVLADGLKQNKLKYGDFVTKNLRRSNLFELHSIDNIRKWINVCKKQIPINLKSYTNFHYAKVITSSFNGRLCTFYEKLPNICPDLIYLDGPDQFSSNGNLRGMSTRHPDRMPMAADVLSFEHFLIPGTIIIVDGRTANARFLKSNLQREWDYFHFENFDQHIFLLTEKPLGQYNKNYLDFINIKN